MFFYFQTKTTVSMILYACLYSNAMICVHEPKKAWKHSLFGNFHKFVAVSYSHADSVAVRSNHFLSAEWLFDAKVLLNGPAVTQNHIFVVFRSQATKNNSDEYLIRHAKESIVMKILMQFRTNVNYMAKISDCLIEICYTHTITFGYQTHFPSQFTFK